MKKYSEFQKFISVLMLFILMLEFTGCYSTKIISTSDISSSEMYVIHLKKVAFSVYEVEISDSLLTGKLDLNKMKHASGNRTHIYLSVDSVLKVNNDNVSLPVKSIAKIEQKIPDRHKTRVLTTCLIVAGGVGVGIGIIALAIGAFNAIYEIAYPSDNSTGCCSNW
jgi:hypothetical protein